MTQSVLLAIWAANLVQGGSIKKFKQVKKGLTDYVENIDFLIGHNPIRGLLQIVVNGGLYPLTYTSQTFVDSPPVVTDPHFYFVVAVTATVPYSFEVDDYGGQGPVTLTGSYEVPLWNELETGPDPSHPSGGRNYPWNYRWKPSYGATVYIDNPLPEVTALKVYYAQLMDATSYEVPIAKLRMVFEEQLGNGDEYADAGLSSQQIIYPHFAGVGSSELDLGASGAIPQLLPEVAFKWGNYPSGDADFVDMIEDIFKSGLAQAAVAAAPATTQMERGLSSYQMPGCIQQKINISGGEGTASVTPNMQTTAGNLLVVVTTGAQDPPDPTISDTAGNSWTLAAQADGFACWYAIAVGGATTISTNAANFSAWSVLALEIHGIDSFDALEFATGGGVTGASITASAGASDGYLLAVLFAPTGGTFAPAALGWNQLDIQGAENQNWPGLVNKAPQTVMDRLAPAAGVYPLTLYAGSPADSILLLSFKSANPVTYPKPLGDFIDLPSLELTRQQCRANGLWGSLAMTSQSAASDWLKSLYQAANAAPVYLGDKLYSIPYSEVSTAGNGALYTAPTASGPIASLTAAVGQAPYGDFIADGEPEVDTADRIDLDNVLQLQITCRSNNYNQLVVTQAESATMALYGVRKSQPVVNNAIQTPEVALMILGIMVRKNQYGGDVYTFTLSPRWMLLSPMDLVTITDALAGIVGVPVRITSCSESDAYATECEAEPFIYGMCAPTPYTANVPAPNPVQTNVSAGNINPPIIFEPVPQLCNEQPQAQLWLVISCASAAYGGCQVMVSTDGGASYIVAGNPVLGNATMGVLTAPWPAAADPDTTNNLYVDLTESNGILASISTQEENQFVYPCIVTGADLTIESDGTPVASISLPATIKSDGTTVAAISLDWNYELMAYAVATLTAPNQYELMATGAGNELRRAVYGAPAAGEGVTHTTGERFALLPPAGTGIFKINLPSQWVGVELFFKILSFNTFGTALQSESDVVAYSYTPTGVPYA